MYVNDRDQINYHGFLKALREMQGAALRHVAEGICSGSEVSRTEIGDRLPEKLMRDRITSRLGVSGEEYEEYLRPEEYRQWEIRMFILEHINKGDVEAVEKGIDEYDKIADKNPVQEQFIDTMRYILAQMKGTSEDVLRAMMELIVAHTVPDIDAAFRGAQLLADQELNLIAEYTHIREYEGSEDEFEWRLAEYLKILDYVDGSYMDTIGRSKVYPRTTYFICEWILNHKPKKKDLELAFELCTKSIELLRDASRLYYFVELLEYRREIISRLLKFKMTNDRRNELTAMYEKDGEWENLFKELYTEYDVPVYMQNFTYLYVETECNDAVDVIRTRRNMVKLSREKVCVNICSDKTVERFENYLHSPSIVIIRDIFERIGLCAEYKRARVITDNAEMFSTYKTLIKNINNFDIEEATENLEFLKEHLHMDISYNRQEIKRVENLINMREGVLNRENFYNNTIEALECTVPMWALLKNKNIEKVYLSRSELACIYDIAFKTEGDFKYRSLEILEDTCSEFMRQKCNVSKMSVYELIVCVMASNLGNSGDYITSNKMGSKMLKECLTNRRMNILSDVLYNNLWNYQKQFHDRVDGNIVKNTLEKCALLSELPRKSNWLAFFQNKILELSD